jgi:serine/threonine protein kinase
MLRGGSPVDESTANDKTLEASVGFDATVAQSNAPTLASAPSAILPRSTVLPRFEMVGTEPRLVTKGQRRYETVRRLGEGGFGEVLGARDNDIGRDVAVKRLRPEMRTHSVLARFAEEVRTIGSLEHPNIVPIHDVGVEENGDYYFVMKYVDGVTLETIIEKLSAGDPETHARFGFERRVQIFAALLEAVAFAHSKGVIHRDIKPANVMIGAYGEVVLMDWGIAKRLHGEDGAPAALPTEPRAADGGTGGSEKPSPRGTLFRTRVGELIGTPAYMSPEQSRGDSIDERSDVYSLSVLFYELLSLRHPLASKQTLPEMLHAVSHEAFPLGPNMTHPHQTPVPPDLVWYLVKGLEKNPADRYQSVAEMITRLERRAEGDIPVQCPITFMKRGTNLWARFIDRHHVLAGVAAVVLLAFSVIGGVETVARLLR